MLWYMLSYEVFLYGITFNAQEEEADELRARDSNCVSKKQFSLSGEPAGLGLSAGYGGVQSYLVPAATGPAALP